MNFTVLRYFVLMFTKYIFTLATFHSVESILANLKSISMFFAFMRYKKIEKIEASHQLFEVIASISNKLKSKTKTHC